MVGGGGGAPTGIPTMCMITPTPIVLPQPPYAYPSSLSPPPSRQHTVHRRSGKGGRGSKEDGGGSGGFTWGKGDKWGQGTESWRRTHGGEGVGRRKEREGSPLRQKTGRESDEQPLPGGGVGVSVEQRGAVDGNGVKQSTSSHKTRRRPAADDDPNPRGPSPSPTDRPSR